MSDLLSKAEKDREFFKEHDRLAKLYVTDRFAFEMERKQIIDKTIDNMCCNEEFKEKLRVQQKDWDRILKGAGSAENRFAMIQALFWHHVVNEWQPALQEFLTTLNSLKKSKRNRSVYLLFKKVVEPE